MVTYRGLGAIVCGLAGVTSWAWGTLNVLAAVNSDANSDYNPWWAAGGGLAAFVVMGLLLWA